MKLSLKLIKVGNCMLQDIIIDIVILDCIQHEIILFNYFIHTTKHQLPGTYVPNEKSTNISCIQN